MPRASGHGRGQNDHDGQSRTHVTSSHAHLRDSARRVLMYSPGSACRPGLKETLMKTCRALHWGCTDGPGTPCQPDEPSSEAVRLAVSRPEVVAEQVPAPQGHRAGVRSPARGARAGLL